MVEKKEKNEKPVTRMFAGDETSLFSDEQLAVHIYHRFNICGETLEEMPAFKDHLNCFFTEKE